MTIADCSLTLLGTVLVSAVLGTVAGSSPAAAQSGLESEAFVDQATAPLQQHGSAGPRISIDQETGDLRPSFLCGGFSGTGGGCVLSSPAPVPLGKGNATAIVQHGDGNVAHVLQQGEANVIHASQVGVDNSLHATQIGDDNLVGTRLVGDDNAVDIHQQGNGNAYLLGFEGSGLSHSVRQIGNKLRLVQLGSGSRPFDVEQRGVDMTIRIEHGPLGAWP